MKKLVAAPLLLALGFIASCGSTFVVSKDGKGYYFGSGSTSAYRMLCESEDLEKVLADSQLPSETRNDLNRFTCSAERSKDRVKRLYASLTPEQRKDLRLAFKKNGYEINAMLC